ncbi:MAG: hypothetical protein LQ340_003727 [Diploschistes diacapsis]|nr:MAG: hypothetical protein LQ340_003727 [Diploschistes diacapsis]
MASRPLPSLKWKDCASSRAAEIEYREQHAPERGLLANPGPAKRQGRLGNSTDLYGRGRKQTCLYPSELHQCTKSQRRIEMMDKVTEEVDPWAKVQDGRAVYVHQRIVEAGTYTINCPGEDALRNLRETLRDGSKKLASIATAPVAYVSAQELLIDTVLGFSNALEETSCASYGSAENCFKIYEQLGGCPLPKGCFKSDMPWNAYKEADSDVIELRSDDF